MRIIYNLSLCFLLVTCASNRPFNKASTSVVEKKEKKSDNKSQEVLRKNFPFKEKTKAYGLENITANNINIVDLNTDGYSDIVIIPTYYAEPDFYYFNPKEKKFFKHPSTFENSPRMSNALFYDINKDGVVDAITSVLNQDSELSQEPIRLYFGHKKENKVFFKQQFKFDTASPSATLGLIDIDLNGTLDLFVGNWFKKSKYGPVPVPDQLFVFDGKKFIERSELLLKEYEKNTDETMHVNAKPTYAATICDLDQDGFPDIITGSTNKFVNKMWMSRYRFRKNIRNYEDYGVSSGVAGDPDGLLNSQGSGRTFALACADYNNDTIMDLFLGELTHNYDGETSDKSSLLTGRSLKFPPKFYRTEYFVDSEDPFWHQADRRGVWVDLNNDGLLDLIVDNSGYPPHTKMIVFMQRADHSFDNKAQELGLDIINPTSTVVADFNRDGKMDILTARSNIRDDSIKPRLYLFENQLDLKDNRSIRLYPEGKYANKDALNGMAIIKVKNHLGEISTRRQYINYSYGALAPQNEKGLHFGIGKNEELISITLRWPYASLKKLNRSKLERIYVIKENFKESITLTLCESGKYLLGKTSC